MNIPCEIIKDLLPLYHDNVCSTESRIMVEEHIKECPTCKKLLDKISEELLRPANAADEAKPIKAIQAVWKRDKAKSFLKGALIAVAIFAVLSAGFVGLTQWKVVPLSSELLDVSEVCQLSDGRIVCRLKVNDDKELRLINFVRSEYGEYYMTPKRSVIEGTRSTEFGEFDHYFDIDVARLNAEAGADIISWYFGTPDDRILIWEEGMDLPAASAELEEKFLQMKTP